MSDPEDREATRIVRAGRRPEWTGPIVNPPPWRASTILFDSVAEMRAAKPDDGIFYYGLHGTPTQWALAEALTALEPGAAGTKIYGSGLAAVAVPLLACLSKGDELLMVDNVYGPTRRLCDGMLKRFGIATTYYDPLIGEGISELIGERTRAVFMESPGSLTMEVQDVPAICASAKARGVATILDNTWATPLFFPAMAAGVDLSIMALSKYVGGHADLLLGSVTANAEWFERLERTGYDLGQSAAPDDCFLAARGLRTLGVRLRQHEANGLAVAKWLREQPQVARVLHPALPDCPGHEYWERDFKGAAGLFSFVLRGGSDEDRTGFIERLRLFGLGYSWGGFESLAMPVDAAPIRTATHWQSEGPVVRLQIGLEDPLDLVADLAQALAGYGATA